jgi:hypothetical protein
VVNNCSTPFGILTCQWRILKTGTRLQGMEVTTNVWKTCCALPNWLLAVDGMDGEWDGRIGQHGINDVTRHIPFALQRLEQGLDPRSYNASGMGPGNDWADCDDVIMETNNNEECDDEAADGGNVRSARHLSLAFFRKKLKMHFDILFKHYQLVWLAEKKTDKLIANSVSFRKELKG